MDGRAIFVGQAQPPDGILGRWDTIDTLDAIAKAIGLSSLSPRPLPVFNAHQGKSIGRVLDVEVDSTGSPWVSLVISTGHVESVMDPMHPLLGLSTGSQGGMWTEVSLVGAHKGRAGRYGRVHAVQPVSKTAALADVRRLARTVMWNAMHEAGTGPIGRTGSPEGTTVDQ